MTYLSGDTKRRVGVWSQESAAEESPRTLQGAGGRAVTPLGPQGQLTPLQSPAICSLRPGSLVPVAPFSYPSNRPFLTSQGQDSGVWEPENLLAKLFAWGSLPSVVLSMCQE